MADGYVIETGSKLSIHAQRTGYFDHLRTAEGQGTPFPLVKMTQGFTALSMVKRDSPETWTLARSVAPHDGMQGIENITDAEVEEWASIVLEPLYSFADAEPATMADIDIWELINEADPPNEQGYLMLGRVLRRCAQRMAEDFPGTMAGVGSFNMGTPEYEEMIAFANSGIFEEGNVFLCLHEGVPSPDDPIDKWHSSESDHPDAGLIPGAPSVPENGGALFGRVAYWHQILGDQLMPPTIITEAYLHAYNDVEELARRVVWVDDLYSKMWYVIGFMPFTHSPTSRWENQDYTPAYPRLIQHMNDVRDRVNAPAPWEEEEEMTLEESLWEKSQEWTINEDAALQKALFDNGYVPYAKETWYAFEGVPYATQVGFDWPTRKRVLSFARVGDWQNVRIIEGPGGVPRPEIVDIVDALPKHQDATYSTRSLSAIQSIAVHHSGPPTTGQTSPQTIASYHVNSLNWPGIGYHYYIMGDGTIYQTNYHETVSYHVGYSNEEAIGICLAGDFTNVSPTQAQLESAAHLADWLREELPGRTVRPHNDYNQTACPGATWQNWWSRIVGDDAAPTVSLPVPYLSQWGQGAGRSNGDCGPATVAMIARYYTGLEVTVDAAAIACGQPPGSSFITWSQLREGLNQFSVANPYRTGLTLAQIRSELDAGHPIILLVHYGAIEGRQDVNFTGGHFFIAVGYGADEQGNYFLVNDSNFWGERATEGDHRRVSATVLENAMVQASRDGNPVRTGVVAPGLADPPPPPPPTGELVDLLPYLRGDGRGYMVRHPAGNEEKFRTVVDGSRWLQLKNSQYEEFLLEGDYVWRGIDTSAGEGNYYRQSETGRLYAKWCPRNMRIGQTWTSPDRHTVQTFSKASCAPVDHHRNGNATNTVALVDRYSSRTWNGITINDVIALRTHTGEVMYFARGYGLVAWEAGWGSSAIANILPPNEWDNRPEQGCFS